MEGILTHPNPLSPQEKAVLKEVAKGLLTKKLLIAYFSQTEPSAIICQLF